MNTESGKRRYVQQVSFNYNYNVRFRLYFWLETVVTVLFLFFVCLFVCLFVFFTSTRTLLPLNERKIFNTALSFSSCVESIAR